jgi:hypothetical protein
MCCPQLQAEKQHYSTRIHFYPDEVGNMYLKIT